MATKIQVRRDAAADWTSTNPTLAAGEIGFESDTNKFKIGDGATAWTSLNYAPEGYATTSYVDTQDANIASDTLTFTNKTFDANGTGNSISNIETADIAAGTLVTAAEGIGSNNNDTTIPTSAAVKAYADSVGGGGASTGDITFTGSTIQSPSNAAITLDPSGTGTIELNADTNVTGDLTTSAVSITDNLITTNRSNDDLRLSTNGTGRIGMSTDGSDFWNNALYSSYFGNPNGVVKTLGVSSVETVDANTAARNYVLGVAQNTTLSGSSSTNSQFRQRTLNLANSMDMAGYSFTQASVSRGPKAATFGTNIVNSSSTASTLYTAIPAEFFCSAYADTSTYAAGDLTITAPIGLRSVMELDSSGGAGNVTYTTATGIQSKAYVHTNDEITTHYLFQAQPGNDGAGGTITNSYAYYVAASTGGVGTNYAFYDASNSLSVFGDIQTQAISITDNHISTNRSNDNLYIQANGTGRVNMGDVKLEDAAYWNVVFGNASRIKGTALTYEDLAVNPNSLTDRELGHGIYQGTKITASSTNSNFRPRAALIGSIVDLAGFSYTNTSNYRGPLGAQIYAAVLNGTSTAVTCNTVRGVETSASVSDFTTTSGAITVVDAIGNFCSNYHDRDGTGDINITNEYGFKFAPEAYNANGGTGTTTITNSYAFHCQANGGNATVTNAYAFYSTDATASSRMGAIRLDNQSGDPTHGADFSWIFAKDESSSSEVFVKDEAGNVTKISPHNAAGEWEYYSKNSKTGKTVRINMEKLVAEVEKLSGKSFIESE